MAGTKARAMRKTSGRLKQVERRRAPRGKLQLLTAFRCLEGNQVTSAGFARALNLSTVGALLESPDPMSVGQVLSMEFLLDNNRIARVRGHVTRVEQHGSFCHLGVEFEKVPVRHRRLLERQVAGGRS